MNLVYIINVFTQFPLPDFTVLLRAFSLSDLSSLMLCWSPSFRFQNERTLDGMLIAVACTLFCKSSPLCSLRMPVQVGFGSLLERRIPYAPDRAAGVTRTKNIWMFAFRTSSPRACTSHTFSCSVARFNGTLSRK